MQNAFARCCTEKLYKLEAVPHFNAKRATFNFLLAGLYARIKKSYGRFSHYIADSTYFVPSEPIDDETLEQLKDELKKLTESDKKLELVEMDQSEVCSMFMEQEREAKAECVGNLDEEKLLCVKFEEMLDIVYEPMVLQLNELGNFKLYKFDEGLLLQLPTARNP